MSPELFGQLSQVMGFNEHNGSTYLEHIILRFSELDQSVKDEILKSGDNLTALKILNRNGVNWTHVYDDSR